MKDTLSFLVQSLLKNNKINVDGEELDFQIQSHPSYPSLHAITGVLTHLDIDNTAIRVLVDKNTLVQLPTSFIAQLKVDHDTFFALVIKKKGHYKIIESSKKSKTISETTFLEQFTGILVAVEQDETTPKNQTNTANFQKPLFSIAVVLFIFLFFSSGPNFTASIHFILSLIGVGISYLIIQHDLGLSSKIIDSICSQENKATNCSAVLNSKGATLYKNIKLSDMSLVYFVSTTCASLFLGQTNESLNSLYLISVTGLPVVIYSIYYQVKVSKNWCVLCLGIAGVLLLQASIFFFMNFNFSLLSIESSLLVGLPFIITTSMWLFVSSKLKQQQDFKRLKLKSIKFKRNFYVFHSLLKQSETVNIEIANTSEIILGNKEAPLNITVITNPFCGHCKSTHHLIETILKGHHNEVSITIRFNVNTNNGESNGVKVSSRLLELFHKEGALKCLEAMHDIYANNAIESWINKWGACNALDYYTNTLKNENEWCINNNINFTPELLINGKSLPKAYDRKELTYFIEDLAEFYQQEKSVNVPFILKYN